MHIGLRPKIRDAHLLLHHVDLLILGIILKVRAGYVEFLEVPLKPLEMLVKPPYLGLLLYTYILFSFSESLIRGELDAFTILEI